MANSEGIELTAEEQAAFAALKDKVVGDPNLAPLISEEMCVQALMARKFEVDRGFELLNNSMIFSHLISLKNITFSCSNKC